MCQYTRNSQNRTKDSCRKPVNTQKHAMHGQRKDGRITALTDASNGGTMTKLITCTEDLQKSISPDFGGSQGHNITMFTVPYPEKEFID